MPNLLERYSTNWSPDSIRLNNTPSSTAKSLYYYVQEAGYFKTFYPYFTERGQLNSFLLIVTLSGTGQLTLGDQCLQIKPGQLCFINCMEHHLYQTLKGRSWEFLWIHFNGPDALGFFQEFEKSKQAVFTADSEEFYKTTLQSILKLCQEKSAGNELRTSQLLYTLLTHLLLQFSSASETDFRLPPPVKATLQEIERCFRTDISLDLLAERVHMSKYHLAREFKKYTGLSIGESIISARITYAKELLKYTRMPVSEIAYACGMNHISHFIRLFKEREDITPLAYRKEWEGTL